jgi:hypothetical protein
MGGRVAVCLWSEDNETAEGGLAFEPAFQAGQLTAAQAACGSKPGCHGPAAGDDLELLNFIFTLTFRPPSSARFSGDAGAAYYQRRVRRTQTRGAALHLAEGSDFVHHQSAADEFNQPRRA